MRNPFFNLNPYQIPLPPSIISNFIVNQNNQQSIIISRSIFISMIHRDISQKDIEKLCLYYGNVYEFSQTVQHTGTIQVTFFDIRDSITAREDIKKKLFYGHQLFCEFCPDPKKICDSILIKPKINYFKIEKNIIFNYFKKFGDINNIDELSKNEFIIEFFDCRIPVKIIQLGEFYIKKVIFIPTYSSNFKDYNLNISSGLILNDNNNNNENIVQLIEKII